MSSLLSVSIFNSVFFIFLYLFCGFRFFRIQPYLFSLSSFFPDSTQESGISFRCRFYYCRFFFLMLPQWNQNRAHHLWTHVTSLCTLWQVSFYRLNFVYFVGFEFEHLRIEKKKRNNRLNEIDTLSVCIRRRHTHAHMHAYAHTLAHGSIMYNV